MGEFRIEIAGSVAEVHSLFESTRDYCRAYLTEKTPDFSVTVTREAMEFEQKWSEEEAREEGFRIRKFSEPFLERAVIQRSVAEFLFDRGILMFHGSAVAVDGEGYLFTAKSGTGKSTHTRLWRQVFGQRAEMINDDKPFLQIAGETVLVCGAPWSGKHGLDSNVAVPLKGICVLERGTENRIRQVESGEVMEMLRKQGYRPLDGEKEPKFREMVEILAEKTALWKMECNQDARAAVVSYEAMSGKEYQKL